jgi:hypothetical protein
MDMTVAASAYSYRRHGIDNGCDDWCDNDVNMLATWRHFNERFV